MSDNTITIESSINTVETQSITSTLSPSVTQSIPTPMNDTDSSSTQTLAHTDINTNAIGADNVQIDQTSTIKTSQTVSTTVPVTSTAPTTTTSTQTTISQLNSTKTLTIEPNSNNKSQNDDKINQNNTEDNTSTNNNTDIIDKNNDVDIIDKNNDVDIIDKNNDIDNNDKNNDIDNNDKNNDNDEDEDDFDDELYKCDVCRFYEGDDESNPILICDKCNVPVHVECYGAPLNLNIPDDEWICDRCEQNEMGRQCALCPRNDGMMKRTTDWRWVHLSCAQWIPECFFRRPEGMDPIDCLQIPAFRFASKCMHCKVESGATMQCSQPGCNNFFHITCGLEQSIYLSYQQNKKGADVIVALCAVHSHTTDKKKKK